MKLLLNIVFLVTYSWIAINHLDQQPTVKESNRPHFLFFNKSGYWNLPAELSDSNALIRYKMPTSLHTVEGLAQKISGKVWLADERDHNSIQAKIAVPISEMSSGNDSRDSKMSRVMAADQYPNVTLDVLRAEKLCLPSTLQVNQSCNGSLIARINIRGVSTDITVPVSAELTSQGYKVTGSFKLRWKDFGIEDPSTFLAKLYDYTEIEFECQLAPH